MISEGPLQLNYSTGILSATGWFQALHAKATWNTHTRTHTISTYEFSIQRQHSLWIRCEFLTIFNYKCLFCILVKTIESLLLRKIQRDLLFILTPGWRQIFNYQINSSWHFFHLAPRISWEQCAALRQMLDFFLSPPTQNSAGTKSWDFPVALGSKSIYSRPGSVSMSAVHRWLLTKISSALPCVVSGVDSSRIPSYFIKHFEKGKGS